MSSRTITLIAAICILNAGCAGSNGIADPEPIKPGIVYFDCDSPPGRLSLSSYQMPAAITELAGEFRINILRRHPAWLPAANIWVTTLEGEPLINLRLQTVPGRSNAKLGLVLSRGEVASVLVEDDVRVAQSVPFRFLIDEDGQVVAKVGISGQEFGFDLGGKPMGLTLNCSTSWSEFNFHRLRSTGSHGSEPAT